MAASVPRLVPTDEDGLVDRLDPDIGQNIEATDPEAKFGGQTVRREHRDTLRRSWSDTDYPPGQVDR